MQGEATANHQVADARSLAYSTAERAMHGGRVPVVCCLAREEQSIVDRRGERVVVRARCAHRNMRVCTACKRILAPSCAHRLRAHASALAGTL